MLSRIPAHHKTPSANNSFRFATAPKMQTPPVQLLAPIRCVPDRPCFCAFTPMRSFVDRAPKTPATQITTSVVRGSPDPAPTSTASLPTKASKSHAMGNNSSAAFSRHPRNWPRAHDLTVRTTLRVPELFPTNAVFLAQTTAGAKNHSTFAGTIKIRRNQMRNGSPSPHSLNSRNPLVPLNFQRSLHEHFVGPLRVFRDLIIFRRD
jgi:hypothetical protein